MGSKNIFDTRNIIKETPKLGNRFLLTADPDQLEYIIFGRKAVTTGVSPVAEIKKSKIFRLSELTETSEKVFRGTSGGKPSEVLDLSLLSCTIPAFEFETGDVNRYNDSIKHITKFSPVNDMSTAFYDYINGSATSIMLAWQSKVGFKLTGEIGYKSQYTCDMDLYVYGPNRPGYKVNDGTVTGNDTDRADYELLMQFKIFNAYPRSVDIGEFSYDNAEIKKVQVQFGYDMIVPYKNDIRSGRNTDSGYNIGLQVDQKDAATAAKVLDNSDGIYDVFISTKQ